VRSHRWLVGGLAVAIGSLCLWPARACAADESAGESRYTAPGVLGGLRAGPVLSLGAPDGLRADLALRYRGVVSMGAGLGTLPSFPVPGMNAKVTRIGGDAWVRWHPMRGAFFVGAGAGYTQLRGTMQMPVRAFRVTSTAQADAYAGDFYVCPQLGLQWVLPHGITLGFDAGVELPIATREPTYAASQYGLVVPVNGTGSVATAMHYASKSAVPYVHLLNVGVFL
jgi:hypothetical protein